MKTADLSTIGPKVLPLIKAVGRKAYDAKMPVYLVGGAVRDILLKRPVLDVDIVIQGDAIAFARGIASQYLGTVKSHKRFGTSAVSLPAGIKLDMVTAREETYAHPGALPDIKPAGIREDLFRRDFTVNAMAVSISPENFGDLKDDFNGQADLKGRVLRVLHDKSFVDDPTRIIRAARYATRFGFSIEPHTRELLRQAVAGDCLSTLTAPRYWNEFRRILDEKDPWPALRLLKDFGVMKYFSFNEEYAKTGGRLTAVKLTALLLWDVRDRAEELLTGFNVGRPEKLKVLELLQSRQWTDMLVRNPKDPATKK